MRYDTTILDLDGTLLYTIEDIHNSINIAMDFYGWPRRTLAEIQSFIGNGLPSLFRQAAPTGLDPDTLLKANLHFHDIYTEHIADLTRPYDGIPEMLRELSRMGVKHAIVSNKLERLTNMLADKFFPGLIGVAYGERPDIPKKPDPALVLKAIADLGSTPERTLYLGDSPVDGETAKNAGVRFVGVSWGYRPAEQLLQAGADPVITSPAQFVELFRD